MKGACQEGRGLLLKAAVLGGGRRLRGPGVQGASEGVIVAVLGLAELVEKEDDGLEAQDEHDAPDEARRVKRVLVRLACRDQGRGAGVGCGCGDQQDKVSQWGAGEGPGGPAAVCWLEGSTYES